MSLYPFHKSRRSGFTLVELAVVIVMIAILSIAALLMVNGRRNVKDLSTAEEQMAAVIREAQSRSASEYQNTAWGVYLSNITSTAPFYALFSSGTYSSGTTAAYYRLPTSVAYVASSLPLGSTSSLTFAEISGLASVSTSISLYSKAEPSLASMTISISASGAVSY